MCRFYAHLFMSHSARMSQLRTVTGPGIDVAGISSSKASLYPFHSHPPSRCLMRDGAGDYYNFIQGKLSAAGQPADDASVNNSLWHCLGEDDGDIEFVQMCSTGGLYGGGPKTNDVCNS